MNRLLAYRTDAGLLAMRLMLGVVFMFHGSQKIFGAFGGPGIDGFAAFNESLGIPLPYAGAWAAALAEFVGGLALLTGAGVAVVAVPLVFTMLVAAFVAHSGFAVQNGGMEYPLLLAVMVAGLALTGAGRFTLAHALRGSHVQPQQQPARATR